MNACFDIVAIIYIKSKNYTIGQMSFTKSTLHGGTILNEQRKGVSCKAMPEGSPQEAPKGQELRLSLKGNLCYGWLAFYYLDLAFTDCRPYYSNQI